MRKKKIPNIFDEPTDKSNDKKPQEMTQAQKRAAVVYQIDITKLAVKKLLDLLEEILPEGEGEIYSAVDQTAELLNRAREQTRKYKF